VNNSTPKSIHYTSYKRAKLVAWLWTLLIFILCFIPGKDLPDVKVPLIDKWAHIILFGVFSYLWHAVNPANSTRYRLILLIITIYMGWLVEYMQGHYVPGRSQDNMDTLADGIGGLVGVMAYSIYYKMRNTRA
jgi:VanZ family protein